MASKGAVWTGRILSALPVLMLAMSAVMKFMRPPQVVDAFVGHFGYPIGTLTVPGVVLVTGYLGGAIATHVRIGEAFVIPLALGVMAWAGLYLRDPRLRALLPLRS